MAQSTTTDTPRLFTSRAADRATRLMRAGAGVDAATNDAGHFFSCSARLVRFALKASQSAAPAGPDDDEDERDPGQRRPCRGHEWAYTGTAYGGDDESYHGEGRAYCIHCGADGDA